MPEHPLYLLISEWLPAYDFAVFEHGFAKHGRDYVFTLQAGVTFELSFTHVVEQKYETRVADGVWRESWDDRFVDFSEWQNAGEPDGYVWGTNWSLAYPGIEIYEEHPSAKTWSERLRRPMYAVSLRTDRFLLFLVFHGAHCKKISDDRSLIERVIIPGGPINRVQDEKSGD